MRICVDIDGVLFPWDIAARDTLLARFGIALGPSTAWHGIRDSVDSSTWRWLWSAEGQDVVFGQTSRCYESAVRAVDALLRLGHEVHFVTHRDPRRTLHHTAEFLGRHFPGGPAWAGVHSVKSRTPKRSLGRWDVMIDDKPETVLDMAARESAMVFAPLRPWNAAELEGRDGPYLHVYTNPWDVVRWVEVNAPARQSGVEARG